MPRDSFMTSFLIAVWELLLPFIAVVWLVSLLSLVAAGIVALLPVIGFFGFGVSAALRSR